jgi:1-acyl-sn-glycerol-3-phosphate acyltransferase
VLGLTGWRIEGELPDASRLVIAVAPHTSNWDFLYGAAAMFALDLKVSFLAKHTLFVWPVSGFLRWMGGLAIDRGAPDGVVPDAVRAFSESPARVLVVAPQGTRRAVTRFKTGFLRIAREARVPLVLVALDYGARCVRIGPAIESLGDIEVERERVEAWFAPIRGRHAR